jgi:putative phosphonate metabolism protein
MSERGKRYAIYYAPRPDDPLWRFGCHSIGYDAETGSDCSVPHTPALDQKTWLALTEEPRRYGFHGTLKAPFHLAKGVSEGALVEGLAEFALARKAFRLAKLDVNAVGDFVALEPVEPNLELQDLASACVEELDRFRAPLDESDMARRLAAPLTQRQKELLEAWGYPYVMEEFRFHMTLTSALSNTHRSLVLNELRRRYRKDISPADRFICGIALFRQETRDARFRILQRFSFKTDHIAEVLT